MAIFTNIEKLENIKNEFKTIMVENNIPLDDYVPFKNYPSMIRNNIGLLKDVKSDLKAAIENKGVSVPDEASINSYADYIEHIETNPKVDLTEWINYFEQDDPEITKFPTGINRIGSFLYWKQKKVQNITGDSVSVVGFCAFEECNTLKSIDFPNLTAIEDYAFKNCTALTSLNTPKLESIGKECFFNANLSGDYLNVGQLKFIDDNAFSNAGVQLHAECLNDLETINKNALYSNVSNKNTKIYGDIKFNNPVKIDRTAFYGVQGSYTVSFPNGGTISQLSFAYSTGLTKVDLKNVEFVKSSDNYEPNGTFQNCTLLTDVLNVPEIIPYETFKGCSQLVNIDISKCKGVYGFQQCTSLTELTFDEDVEIGYSAFSGCTNLRTVTFNGKVTFGVATVNGVGSNFYNCTNLENVVFKDEATLKDSVFSNCTSLKSIDLTNVISIGNNCFGGCNQLTTVKNYHFASVPNGLFNGCSALKQIELPNVTWIGSNSFYNTNIEFMEFPQCISCGNGSVISNNTVYAGFKQGFSVQGTTSSGGASPVSGMSKLRLLYISSNTNMDTHRLSRPVSGTSVDLVIYTDVASEEEVPAHWQGKQWLYIDDTHNAQVVYGASYEDFLAAVEADKALSGFKIEGDLQIDEQGFYSEFDADKYIRNFKYPSINKDEAKELVLHIKTSDDVTTYQSLLLSQTGNSDSTFYVGIRNGKFALIDKSYGATANSRTSEGGTVEPNTEYYVKINFYANGITEISYSQTNDNYEIACNRTRSNICYLHIGKPFSTEQSWSAFKGGIKLDDMTLTDMEES